MFTELPAEGTATVAPTRLKSLVIAISFRKIDYRLLCPAALESDEIELGDGRDALSGEKIPCAKEKQ